MADLITNASWLRSHRRLALNFTILDTAYACGLEAHEVVDWSCRESGRFLELIDAGRADVEKSFRDCLARGWVTNNGPQIWDEVERFVNETGGGRVMNRHYPRDGLGDIMCLTLKGARLFSGVRDQLAGHPVDTTYMSTHLFSPDVESPQIRTMKFVIAANDESAVHERLVDHFDWALRVTRKRREPLRMFCIEKVSFEEVPLFRYNWWNHPQPGVVGEATVTRLAPPQSSPRPTRSLR